MGEEKEITIEELIRRAKDLGFRFGGTTPGNRIRYYRNIGLLPTPVRKQLKVGGTETVAFYPVWAVDILMEIQSLQKQKKSPGEIKETISQKILEKTGVLENSGVHQKPEEISKSDGKTVEQIISSKTSATRDIFLMPPPAMVEVSQTTWQRFLVRIPKPAYSVFGVVLGVLLVSGILSSFAFAKDLTGRFQRFLMGTSYDNSLVYNNNNDKVLAESIALQTVEINADTLINGEFRIRNYELGLTGNSSLNHDLTTTSTPTFACLKSSGVNLLSLPNATTTLTGTDTTQTITNKTMSGSSNTFTNLPNSALSNSKVTVTAGTNVSGGGDVSLGSSITLSLKNDLTLTSATFSGTLGVVGDATISGTLSLGGNFIPLSSGVQNIGSSSLLWGDIYATNFYTGTSGTAGYWQRSLGSVAPTNITDDLLIGGNSTASAKVRISGTTGNINIGTSGNNYTLDLNGKLQITGSGFSGLRMPTVATLNYVLTTDGEGNASWTNTTSGEIGRAHV